MADTWRLLTSDPGERRLPRWLRARLGGRMTHFARTPGTIERSFLRHGLMLRRSAAEQPFLRDLWLASFVRAEANER